MTQLDFTPAVVDLSLWAGDDIELRLFFSTDAPTDGTFRSTWDAGTDYVANDLVELAGVFYVAVASSTNVTPGTDATKWVALTPLDLTGYTNWKSQIRRSAADASDFVIDDSDQATSIISLSMTGATLRSRLNQSYLRWDIQAEDGNGDTRTFFAGKVLITEDATR